MFYGGRTEVFSPCCQTNDKEKLEYHDVCSLYPTVCSHDTLPIKFPVRYFGVNAHAQLGRLNPSHADPIFGYIRCKIQPNGKDCIGLLPSRVDGKLVFDLTVKWVHGSLRKSILLLVKGMLSSMSMRYYIGHLKGGVTTI